jgi:hypothetical protein
VKSSSLNDLERRAWIAAVVFFHDSALKHGISPEDATQAASWPTWIEDLDDDSPARQLRLGFDTRGRLLETIVLVFDSGNELGALHDCDRAPA